MYFCKIVLLTVVALVEASPQFQSNPQFGGNFQNFEIGGNSGRLQGFSNFAENIQTGRPFSNFVDLPSQRLQEKVPQKKKLVGPAAADCALEVPEIGRCVTYTAINNAFIAARDRITDEPLKFQSSENFTNAEVGNLGNVLHETVRELTERYKLPLDVVTDGLSKIDTTKTMIKDYCPVYYNIGECQYTRYRHIEGTCNNIENPHWGAAQMAHHRFLPYAYADGISAPRIAVSGDELPSPRLISAHIHRDENKHEHSITTLMVAWAQLTDHDLTLTAEIDEVLEDDLNCCKGPNVTHPMCFPIKVAENDHFYSKFDRTCMNFVRSNAGLRAECRLGPREQFNQITSVIDSGVVYSNVPETLRKLRTFEGGLMKTLPVFKDQGLKDLLPLNLEDPDKGCIRPEENVYCFFTGDPRVNEQTTLTLLHTMLIREHNMVATRLSEINPHWTDETLFQEARHIIIAFQTHITFNELLPLLLGKEGLREHGLTLYTQGYFDGYDKTINPSVASGFSTAAFRFGHSLLPSTVERWGKNHKYIGNQKLSEMIQQPYDMFKAGWADQYMLGMINQVAQAMDDGITSQVTNHLFEEQGQGFGLDLAALNIQRGREHGIPSYNRYREWCGLKPIRTWDDLHGIMTNRSAYTYPKMYQSPEDIELFTAGVSEIPLKNRLIGPTFSCIIGRQFHNIRHGDRFWYENGGEPSSFTIEQLSEIRKMTLARLVCDTSNHMETLQMRVMLLPDNKINPRVSCNSGQIPKPNLEAWRDLV